MNYQYIEQLIERYFQAETSPMEESILQAFFRQNELPEALRCYAPLFAYEDEQRQQTPLGADFDRRLLDRIEAQNSDIHLRVRAKNKRTEHRLSPLWRAAAAIAIVVVLIGAAHQSVVDTGSATIIDGSAEAMRTDTLPPADNPDTEAHRQLQESMKMAVTVDSARSDKSP